MHSYPEIGPEYVPFSLRRAREEVGLTQAEVAERLGVSQPAVAKWERANDPGDQWPRLAGVLGVGEDYPGAPFDPAERRAWFDARNAVIQSAKLRGSYGHGNPSKGAGGAA